jgi:hypothetical protein
MVEKIDDTKRKYEFAAQQLDKLGHPEAAEMCRWFDEFLKEYYPGNTQEWIDLYPFFRDTDLQSFRFIGRADICSACYQHSFICLSHMNREHEACRNCKFGDVFGECGNEYNSWFEQLDNYLTRNGLA